jgi:hypothetical protein
MRRKAATNQKCGKPQVMQEGLLHTKQAATGKEVRKHKQNVHANTRKRQNTLLTCTSAVMAPGACPILLLHGAKR